MRPDQHKKKKNSEYKKKHGIAPDKGVKHEKNESTSRHRSDGRLTSGEAKAGAARQEIDVADVEDQNSRQERRSFSKRKIETNWDRYEDENFEEEFMPDRASPGGSVSIGADYQSLLDKATSGSSHFQFKNEKDWGNITNQETNNKAGPSLMSIDCHALALSLRNIALEERLEIDKKYSIEDDFCGSNTSKSHLDKPLTNHLKNHQETAKTNNEKLRQNVSTNTNVGFLEFSQPDKLIEETDKEKYSLAHKFNSPVEEKTDQHHLTDLENDKKRLQQRQSENVNVTSTTSVGKDDLELLLGFDNTKELNSTHRENPIVTLASVNKVDEKTAQKPETANDTKEDLEDWLDSILD